MGQGRAQQVGVGLRRTDRANRIGELRRVRDKVQCARGEMGRDVALAEIARAPGRQNIIGGKRAGIEEHTSAVGPGSASSR